MPLPDSNELFLTCLLAILSAGVVVVLDRGLIPALRFRAPRRSAEPPLWGWPEIVLVLGAWHVLQILMTVAFRLLLGADESGATAARAFALAQGSTAVVVILLGLRLVRDWLGQPLSTLGIRRTSLWNLPPTVILWGASLFPMGCILIGWNLLLRALFGHDFTVQEALTLAEGYVQSGDWVSFGCLALSAVVIAPVIEESVFRGGIFGPLRLRWGALAAALVSSVIFGAVHYTLSAFLPLVFLGCLLCYLYQRTGSLLPCMLLHAVFNAATFVKLLWTVGS
jgi:membrane protease YdiL (CAAX protease family)